MALDPNSLPWKSGYAEGQRRVPCSNAKDENWLDGWLTGDAEAWQEEGRSRQKSATSPLPKTLPGSR